MSALEAITIKTSTMTLSNSPSPRNSPLQSSSSKSEAPTTTPRSALTMASSAPPPMPTLSGPPMEFHHFRRLPVELRIMVWKLAVVSRMIKLQPGGGKALGAMYVNRESREEIKKYSQLVHIKTDELYRESSVYTKNFGLWVNYDIDILYVSAVSRLGLHGGAIDASVLPRHGRHTPVWESVFWGCTNANALMGLEPVYGQIKQLKRITFAMEDGRFASLGPKAVARNTSHSLFYTMVRCLYNQQYFEKIEDIFLKPDEVGGGRIAPSKEVREPIKDRIMHKWGRYFLEDHGVVEDGGDADGPILIKKGTIYPKIMAMDYDGPVEDQKEMLKALAASEVLFYAVPSAEAGDIKD